MKVDDIYTHNGTTNKYKIDGLPTIRNALFGLSSLEKWVPGVRYTKIDPVDGTNIGDNQEFIRNLKDFVENFTKEKGSCPKCICK